MPNAVLIVAAGRGSRARPPEAASSLHDTAPKQYALIGGEAVLTHTLRVFLAQSCIDIIQVVIHEADRTRYDDAIRPLGAANTGKLAAPVRGGDSRQASVRLGLEALVPLAPNNVLIHDAARPFVSGSTIEGVVTALGEQPGVIAAMPVADTLQRAGSDQIINETVARDGLWRAQTPQGFHFEAIVQAHRRALDAGEADFTDDAAVALWDGLKVSLFEGNAANIKITTYEDLIMADRDMDNLSFRHAPLPDIRTGTGFDVHRFAPGDHVWLCGLKIPHDQTLEGHSDADVGLHALTDALLGAIGDGDIGSHFPPSDPKWKGAASDQFLRHAASRIREHNGIINNVDVTILCETPKIGPHREQMRATIATILDIDPCRVSVKATTTEQLGFTGRGEGIAAMASASLTIAAR